MNAQQVAEAWSTASFHGGWEAEEILKARSQLRVLQGPKHDYLIYSTTVKGGDVLSPDERGYRGTSSTEWTLVVRGRPARSNTWFQSHDEIPGGKISLWESDFAHGKAAEAVCEQVILRLRKRLEEILTFGMHRPLEREWAELVATQLTTWETEDATVIAAAHATWDAEDRLATEADDLKTRAERFSRSPAGNEVGEAPAGFDSWHRPVEELQELVMGLRDWLADAEERRLTILAERREVEIAAGLAKEERLAAIATAMAAPAIPAPWFIGKYAMDVAAIEAATGRKCGEGFGDKLAGARETRYLPGDRSIVALHISSGGGKRYYCTLTSKGLAPLASGSIPEEVGGRHDQQLLALVVEEGWHIVERFFRDGRTTHCTVTTARGTAVVYPDADEVRSRGWNDEDGGPTENEVRKILGLKAVPAPQASEPSLPTPAPMAPPPKPAAPAAVAATLAGLQGKFGKKR